MVLISQLAPPATRLAGLAVDDEQLEEGGDVGAFPVAVDVGFGNADGAAGKGAAGQASNCACTSSASGPGALPPTISVRPSGMRTFRNALRQRHCRRQHHARLGRQPGGDALKVRLVQSNCVHVHPSLRHSPGSSAAPRRVADRLGQGRAPAEPCPLQPEFQRLPVNSRHDLPRHERELQEASSERAITPALCMCSPRLGRLAAGCVCPVCTG